MDKKEAEDLLKKIIASGFNAKAVDKESRKKLKELCSDTDTMVSVMLDLQNNDEVFAKMALEKAKPLHFDGQTDEQIIAENYIALAKFAVEKLEMKNVIGLKAEVKDSGFIIYALTPKPVELDLESFATSEYQNNRELLLEAEALQADLFLEDNTEEYLAEIVNIINNAKLC